MTEPKRYSAEVVGKGGMKGDMLQDVFLVDDPAVVEAFRAKDALDKLARLTASSWRVLLMQMEKEKVNLYRGTDDGNEDGPYSAPSLLSAIESVKEGE